MAVTLAEAKNNALEDYDPFVIDEFRKSSVILDSLIFDDAVNPAGGGATLDYSYRRQETQPTAEFRAITLCRRSVSDNPTGYSCSPDEHSSR